MRIFALLLNSFMFCVCVCVYVRVSASCVKLSDKRFGIALFSFLVGGVSV